MSGFRQREDCGRGWRGVFEQSERNMSVHVCVCVCGLMTFIDFKSFLKENKKYVRSNSIKVYEWFLNNKKNSC